MKIGVFDIDGTIFRSSLLIELVTGLVEAGLFPSSARSDMEIAYDAWSDRKASYASYIETVIGLHRKHIGGCPVDAVKRIAHAVIDHERDRVYVFTRDLIAQLKRDRYRLIAISGSPDYIVRLFADHMGFDTAFGIAYESVAGEFTGKVADDMAWTDKAGTLRRYADDAHLDIDWKRSVAVGDTETDAPLLAMVGRPIAFNPNAGLLKRARKAKWKVVVERKDVIYTIKEYSVSTWN